MTQVDIDTMRSLTGDGASDYRDPIGMLQPLHAARRFMSERGLLASARMGLLFATFPIWSRLTRPGTFLLDGHGYPYFWSNHNLTWLNERAVELSLGEAFLNRHAGRRILEVGNVMSHYQQVSHQVIDKFERGPSVENIDVLDLKGQYDAILSISTLEHVGWDEYPREPSKVLRAFEVLDRALAPGGEMLVTVPVGYNTFIDEVLLKQEIPLTSIRALKRVTESTWIQRELLELENVAYGRPWWCANGLFIGTLKR